MSVRAATSHNERSQLTLLCRRPLVVKGKRIPGHGCNSGKGKFYDPFLRDLLSTEFHTRQINSRHQLSLFAAGYLGLFQCFGYQIALISSGLLTRAQFFQPNSFINNMPSTCQMMLTGESWSQIGELTLDHWRNPISINIEGDFAFIVLRNMIVQLPLSCDPTLPLARSLPYVPLKYKFRAYLTTVFE